jgi:hypothetical protein
MWPEAYRSPMGLPSLLVAHRMPMHVTSKADTSIPIRF